MMNATRATGVGGGTRDVPLAKRDIATPDQQATRSERTKNFTKGVTSEINAGAKKPSHVSDEQWGHVRHSAPRASALTISKTGDVTFYYGSKKVTSGWKVEKVTGGYSVTGTNRIAKTQAAAKRAVATQIIKATNSSQKTYIDTINRRVADVSFKYGTQPVVKSTLAKMNQPPSHLSKRNTTA